MSILATLKPQKGAKKKMKRVGRGDGSGHGGTSTRGHKGQLARTSGDVPRGFEGGQMPLHRRSPKWGFTNYGQVKYAPVNLQTLDAAFKDGEEVTLEALFAKRILRKKGELVKILGRGKLSKSLRISAHAVSESAKKAIEQAKGSVTLLKKAV